MSDVRGDVRDGAQNTAGTLTRGDARGDVRGDVTDGAQYTAGKLTRGVQPPSSDALES